MEITYKITEKGKKSLGSFGKGHADRIMNALEDKKEMTLSELNTIVKRHTDSDAPMTITAWYLCQLRGVGLVKREVWFSDKAKEKVDARTRPSRPTTVKEAK